MMPSDIKHQCDTPNLNENLTFSSYCMTHSLHYVQLKRLLDLTGHCYNLKFNGGALDYHLN